MTSESEELSRYGTGPDDLSEAEPERIIVTDEMSRVGREILLSYGKTVADMYRAMQAIEPKDNGWEPTLHSADFVIRLADERDALLTSYNELFTAHEALLQRLADLEPKPEVKPDPFQPHADERRKIGWVL